MVDENDISAVQAKPPQPEQPSRRHTRHPNGWHQRAAVRPPPNNQLKKAEKFQEEVERGFAPAHLFHFQRGCK